MPDIQTGDLVRYREHVEGQRDQGVWLVTGVESRKLFEGKLVNLRQGNERRYSHVSHLDKISSCR